MSGKEAERSLALEKDNLNELYLSVNKFEKIVNELNNEKV